jgi:hypothetical protein
MKKVIRLTESDLQRIVKRVIKESEEQNKGRNIYKTAIKNQHITEQAPGAGDAALDKQRLTAVKPKADVAMNPKYQKKFIDEMDKVTSKIVLPNMTYEEIPLNPINLLVGAKQIYNLIADYAVPLGIVDKTQQKITKLRISNDDQFNTGEDYISKLKEEGLIQKAKSRASEVYRFSRLQGQYDKDITSRIVPLSRYTSQLLKILGVTDSLYQIDWTPPSDPTVISA